MNKRFSKLKSGKKFILLLVYSIRDYMTFSLLGLVFDIVATSCKYTTTTQ